MKQLAKPEDEYVKQTEMVGTQVYLPPEAEETNYGTHTDAFSFGLVVYEVLVGALPTPVEQRGNNNRWFEGKPLFKCQEDLKDDAGAHAGIGSKLKELVIGLTKYDHQEHWTTKLAFKKLKEIQEQHLQTREAVLAKKKM